MNKKKPYHSFSQEKILLKETHRKHNKKKTEETRESLERSVAFDSNTKKRKTKVATLPFHLHSTTLNILEKIIRKRFWNIASVPRTFYPLPCLCGRHTCSQLVCL